MLKEMKDSFRKPEFFSTCALRMKVMRRTTSSGYELWLSLVFSIVAIVGAPDTLSFDRLEFYRSMAIIMVSSIFYARASDSAILKEYLFRLDEDLGERSENPNIGFDKMLILCKVMLVLAFAFTLYRFYRLPS